MEITASDISQQHVSQQSEGVGCEFLGWAVDTVWLPSGS